MVLSSDYETIYISLIIKWTLLPIVILGIVVQGRSDGGYIRIYTLPKSVPKNYFVH